MKFNRQNLIAILASLGVFLGLGFIFKWNLLVAGALAIPTYFGSYLASQPRLRIGNIYIDELPAGDELRELMAEAYDDMEAIRLASKNISDIHIQDSSEKLYKTGSKILEYLKEEPDKIRIARRFFTYYLDTARNILEKYLRIQDTELRTDEVKQITRSTKEAMPYLNEAFEKQFTNLMANDLMDIEAEIKILKANLKMDS